MPYALAITALILIAKAFDEATGDTPNFGWGMAGLAMLIVAGSTY